MKMKILMVDDDVEITKAVETIITSVGHDFQYTHDPREGLKLIREQEQDMIIMDLSMPEVSGIDIVHDLVKDGKIKEKKIVIMTASAAGDDELKGLVELGVHSFLKKPVDIDAILNKIEEIESS
jgi:two-component system alkaline phosphatase synthesis response regulator PhoP